MGKAKKTKVTKPVESEGLEPGKESREVFMAALDVASGLARSKGLRIDVDVSGDLEMTLDSEKLDGVDVAKFKGELTREFFVMLLHTEFDSLLDAAMYEDRSTGIKARLPQKVVEEMGVNEFLWRVGEVEKALLPASLKQRATLRKTTDAFVVKDLRWRVGLRKHDSERGKVEDIPYGCLSIAYDSARTDNTGMVMRGEGMSIQLPVVREPKQVTFELHEVDVDQLIEVLTELRSKLEKLRKDK